MAQTELEQDILRYRLLQEAESPCHERSAAMPKHPDLDLLKPSLLGAGNTVYVFLTSLTDTQALQGNCYGIVHRGLFRSGPSGHKPMPTQVRSSLKMGQWDPGSWTRSSLTLHGRPYTRQ